MKTKNEFARQAICTRYLGPTNVRGSRIKAHCERGNITVPYPELNRGESHAYACEQLLKKFRAEDCKKYGGKSNGWGLIDEWIIGALPQGSKDAYVFVYGGAK